MKRILGILIFIVCHSAINAQRVCGTVITTHSFDISGANSPHTVSGSSRDTIANEIINIPVVIHVIYNTAAQNISDEQVLSQIKVLNEDYRLMNANAKNIPAAFKDFAADTRINFCLAQVDPAGHKTNGIIHKKTSIEYFLDESMKFSAAGGDNAWDSKKYLNIWVCYIFGRSLGFATMPGGPADKDGVVINYDVFGSIGAIRSEFNLGRTATHEVGHWLGLKHIWGDEACGTDDVDDTPRQRFSNYNIPTFPHATTCSPNANGDMFMNYMDFTDDACMSMFTKGQKNKMRGLFAINGSRNTFLYSTACDGAMASAGPLPQDTTAAIKAPVIAAISIYPNPVKDILNIKSSEETTLTGRMAAVFTTAGRPVLQQLLTSGTAQLNLVSLAPGMYILKIGEGSNRKVFKIIKL